MAVSWHEPQVNSSRSRRGNGRKQPAQALPVKITRRPERFDHSKVPHLVSALIECDGCKRQIFVRADLCAEACKFACPQCGHEHKVSQAAELLERLRARLPRLPLI